MHDLRGINRGHCLECGEDECSEFVQDSDSKFSCGYCGHPPVKHMKCKYY